LASEGLILSSSACSSRLVLGVLLEYACGSKRACALEHGKIRLLGSQAIRKIAYARNQDKRSTSPAKQRSATQNP